MRFTVFSFISLACAAPSLIPRQDTTDYGYWDATVETDGGAPGWSTRKVTATYSNPNLEPSGAKTCTWSFVPQGGSPPVETNKCDEGFSYTWGTPYGTLNLTQAIELEGQQATVKGGATITMRCGLGAGNACRGSGRINASLASS